MSDISLKQQYHDLYVRVRCLLRDNRQKIRGERYQVLSDEIKVVAAEVAARRSNSEVVTNTILGSTTSGAVLDEMEVYKEALEKLRDIELRIGELV